MIWKSDATCLSRASARDGARVVERDERVVEHERRPAVAGHEPDEAEAGGEVDEVERALAEAADRHPIAALGGDGPRCRASCRRPGCAGSDRR